LVLNPFNSFLFNPCVTFQTRFGVAGQGSQREEYKKKMKSFMFDGNHKSGK